MFLSKRHNKQQLFLTLPNKREIMSPANKKATKLVEQIASKGSDTDLQNQKISRRGEERETGVNIDELKLSELMLGSNKEEQSKFLSTSRDYGEFIKIQKSIGRFHEIKTDRIKSTRITLLHVDNDDDKQRKGRSVETKVTEGGLQNNPISSPEKKSVRFLDELFENRYDETVDHSEINTKIDMTARQQESGEESKILQDRSEQNAVTSRGDVTPTGILRKTLHQNPFNLRRERTLEEEKDFRCQECNKSFKYRSNLKTHVLTVHNGAMYKSNGTIIFNSTDDFLVCDICSRFFKYPVNLRAHKAGHARNKLSSTI